MEFLSNVLHTIPMWLVWPVAVGIAVYWYLTKHYDHWKNVGIPYVQPIPLFGSMLQMFTKPMHEAELQMYKKNGRIFGMYEGRSPVLVVGEPDILKDIFVKDFHLFSSRRTFDTGIPLIENMVSVLQGEAWKRVRTVMTPAFSTGKLKRMISIFIDSAKTLTGNFKDAAKEGKPVDMKSLFGTFSMDVISSAAFGTKIDSHSNPDNPFVTHAKTALVNPFPWRFALLFILPGIVRLFKISIVAPSATKFFEEATLQIVEERRRTKQKRNDFLQLMIDAVEREVEKEVEVTKESEDIKEMGHEEGNEQIFQSYQSSKSLSEIELVSNSVVFFLGGYDTTSSTLTFTAYELAVNPDIQDKVIAEIDDAIREEGELNYESLCKMKYLDNVVAETLRKYPPAIRTDRVADEDYEIKSNGMKVTIPKGMIVSIPIYAIQHDPEFYPDPERYNPDRFTEEQKSKRHPYSYLTFGAGPRNCVGMRFALMEIKVCLATILSQCRFSTCSETKVPMEFMRGQGLMQPTQVMLKMKIRK